MSCRHCNSSLAKAVTSFEKPTGELDGAASWPKARSSVEDVCSKLECIELAANSCEQILPCGHRCGGIRNEAACVRCLHGCCRSSLSPTHHGAADQGHREHLQAQSGSDPCVVCLSALSSAPVIRLDNCGHLIHYHCCKATLERRWPSGTRITFSFMLCPICKADIEHCSLESLLQSIRALRNDVRTKARTRLEYEGRTLSVRQQGYDPTEYAVEHYAYYVCSLCESAYYGGDVRCSDQLQEMADSFDAASLICGTCLYKQSSSTADGTTCTRVPLCSKHGAESVSYKCRFCCSVAVFYCFGTTHFCPPCHNDHARLTALTSTSLPQCPAGPCAVQLSGTDCPLGVTHPPTGNEFCLGCDFCRNIESF